MAKGSKIIHLFEKDLNSIDPGILKTTQAIATKSQMQIYDIHSRAIGCHCECMCMDSENVIATMNNTKPPFSNKDYSKVMAKWGLVNEDSEPII